MRLFDLVFSKKIYNSYYSFIDGNLQELSFSKQL